MQRPTCTNVRIRSTQDAHKIFFAIQQGLLHMVTRRLDAEERLALKTGCVYAWEERGPHTEVTGLGIERFTEGRRWSPSRVRDEFLFYYEKYCPTSPDIGPGAIAEKQTRDWDPLVKQTYSVWIETDKGRRKWHLTAYFTQTTVDNLGTIDDIPGMRELVVPHGLFKSTRVGKHRGKGDEQSPRVNETSTRTSTNVTRTYAPFPSLYSHYPAQSKTSESVTMYEPYENGPLSGYSYANDPSPRYSAAASAADHDRNSLPQMQGYFDHAHAESSLSYSSINPSTPSIAHSVVDSLTHTQGVSNDASSGISAHPASHSPSLNSHPPYPVHTQSRPSSSPTILNTPHADEAYSDSFYFPAESPPRYTDRPMHGPSTNYTYSPDTSSPFQSTRGVPNPNSGPTQAYRQEVHMPTSPSQRPLPPLRIDPCPPSYELLPGSESNQGEGRARGLGHTGRNRDLAPMHALTRPHPYRRDPLDDKTLRLLTPRRHIDYS